MVQTDKNSHWTHKLFVENAELYLPFLRDAQALAPVEVGALESLFSAYGLPKGGKVLDVACGIGRHCVPLARRGYQVTGVDISPMFLDEARTYAASSGVEPTFIEGDMLNMAELVKDEAPFDGFINMFTSHSYYGREGDLNMFRQLHDIASRGAVLVVLTANRDWIVRNFLPEGVEKAGDVRILEMRTLDLESSTILNKWEFYESSNESLRLRLSVEMDHRLYSLHELKDLLEEAGWTYLKGLGRKQGEDFQLEPLTMDSNVMWVVARA